MTYMPTVQPSTIRPGVPEQAARLASCDVPLGRGPVSRSSICATLAATAPIDRGLLAVLRASRPTWRHAFLVISGEPLLDVRMVLQRRHGLMVSDLREAAWATLYEQGFAHSERTALHDVTNASETVASGVMRLELFLVGTNLRQVPSITVLPGLESARVRVAA